MKIFRTLISILSIFAIVFSFASCTTMKPVEDYEEYLDDTDPLFNEKTTEKETRDYTEGWPSEVRSYISVYLSEGEYVRTVTSDSSTGTLYCMLYNDVPRDDAIAYGREVGIWEDDWRKKEDNSITVSDKHASFSIYLTHYSKPQNGYNFKITIEIYNESVKTNESTTAKTGGAS